MVERQQDGNQRPASPHMAPSKVSNPRAISILAEAMLKLQPVAIWLSSCSTRSRLLPRPSERAPVASYEPRQHEALYLLPCAVRRMSEYCAHRRK